LIQEGFDMLGVAKLMIEARRPVFQIQDGRLGYIDVLFKETQMI
jgi:hypothetical protein